MPSSSYDAGYRHLFSHPVMVEHLLRGFVPQRWAGELDFATLEKRNGHYVADDLRERADDLVWRVRPRGAGTSWLYVYLLMEFQSRNDDWMALRLLNYVSLLYQDLVKAGEVARPGELPPVFPLVLYHGATQWRAALDVDGLMALAPGELRAYRPRMRYFLLDGQRAARAGVEGDAGNLARELFGLEDSADPQALRRSIMRLDAHLRAPTQASLRRAFTVYVNRVVLRRLAPRQALPGFNDLQEIDAMLADRVEEWTEKWKREGLEKGLRQALCTLIERRFGEVPPQARERIEAAPEPALQRWLAAILDAESLAAVFER